MTLKHKVLLLFVFLSNAPYLFSQINSPYTRYGLGNLQASQFASTRALGGISAAYASVQDINITNPASYGYFYKEVFAKFYDKVRRDTTYFDEAKNREVTRTVTDSVLKDTLFYVFKASSLQTGIYADFRYAQNVSGTNPSGDASLSYLTFGFPIPKFGGISFGLIPFSLVDYNLLTSQTKDTLIGRENEIFNGNGRLYKFNVGIGYKHKGLSLGANAAYLFGNLNNMRANYFPDQINSFGTREIIMNHAGGLTWDAGLQYEHDIKPGITLRFGAYGHSAINVKTLTDTIRDRVIVLDESHISHIDSLTSQYNVQTALQLPGTFGAGLVLQKGSKWLVGLDVNMANWSEYNGLLVNDPLANSWKIKFGGQYLPSLNETETRILSKLTYRGGFYYGKPNLLINQNPLSEFGITFGFGIPVKQKLPRSPLASSLNFAFDFGSTGSIKNNLVKENFFKFTLGLNLNDNFWIFKTKYN